MKLRRLFFCVVLAVVFSAPQASAEPDRQTIPVGISIGDGKGGRIYSQWQNILPNKPVEKIQIRLQKRSGGNDAYVNLRFGNGSKFDNTRQVSLTEGGAPQTITWDTNGASSGGQPLILSAYNCEVDVTSADVEYSASVQAPDLAEGGKSGPIQPRDGSWVRGTGGWGGEDDDDKKADDDQVHWDERPGYPPGGYGGRGNPAAGKRCREMRIQSPRIEVGKVHPTGGLFSGTYRLEGAVAGLCIEEAGYYELGRLKKKIEFPLSDTFQRKEFDISVKANQRGEIRAFTSDGKDETIEVDSVIPKRFPF